MCLYIDRDSFIAAEAVAVAVAGGGGIGIGTGGSFPLTNPCGGVPLQEEAFKTNL
jgi:hypothetical protein